MGADAMHDGRRTRLAAATVLGLVPLLAAVAAAWTPLPVTHDPLVRMPGTQQDDGVVLETSDRCLNCHDGYDPAVDVGFHWRGGMMAQAARDPLYWATVTVALQDSIWALGNANAGDLCLRCHMPSGWLGGRSDPPNGSAMLARDFDGLSCDSCHRMVDPMFEATFAGTREGSDWLGYWDERNVTTPGSATAAATTRTADRVEAAALSLFNGNPAYDAAYGPALTTWTEAGGGQYLMAAAADKRASFADDTARHQSLYSRFHKSRYFCATCHDVSNPVFGNLPQAAARPGDGTTVLASERQPAHAYGHVERTFSEFMVSAYGAGSGAAGRGAYDPSVWNTSRPGDAIAACQDCHMPDRVGKGCDKADAPVRPTDSREHPASGQPLHELTGGNVLVPTVLASTISGSPNYDAVNAALLRAGPTTLTMDLAGGTPLSAPALLAAAERARINLRRAATLEAATYTAASGALSFRVRNDTGHKLPSGYPEGRRVFVNVRVWRGGALVAEVNPFDGAAGTLRGLPASYSPASPPLGPGERHEDALVYEMHASSSLTAETKTFHFALADGRQKDNRIPPRGFRPAEAAARMVQPVWDGSIDPGLFDAAEYSGGYHQVDLLVPAGADGVELSLYYQSTSREYVAFLSDEINGVGGTLFEPTPSGEPVAYIAATDPFFARLRAWGDAIWTFWDHNRAVPGISPVLMASLTIGATGDPCAALGSDGTPCDDGNACTLSDACNAGACLGTAVTCTALDDCHWTGTCDPATGRCSNPTRTDGSPCDDGNGCTTGESCLAGVCTALSPDCSAFDPCTYADTCDVAGTCSGIPYSCAPGPCQAASACDGDGGCTITWSAAGTPCDDIDPCTTGESCDGAGGCGGGTYTCGADADADAEADADADADAAPDVEPDGAPDAEPDGLTDSATDTAPDAEPDGLPDSATDTAPDAEPDAGPDGTTDAATAAAPDAEPDGLTDSATDTAPDAEADAAADGTGEVDEDAAGDAATPPGGDDGCGCAVPGRGGTPLFAGLVTGLLGLTLRRRRSPLR